MSHGQSLGVMATTLHHKGMEHETTINGGAPTKREDHQHQQEFLCDKKEKRSKHLCPIYANIVQN